ncbi:hypothetical protein BaRGS_00008241 [Batillaria attramentaria]|uniref:Secreted protein n=1 Tax=Batillaria attramentaria TaxID=370345 RepID=A0ABD0LM86_9CAEN
MFYFFKVTEAASAVLARVQLLSRVISKPPHVPLWAVVNKTPQNSVTRNERNADLRKEFTSRPRASESCVGRKRLSARSLMTQLSQAYWWAGETGTTKTRFLSRGRTCLFISS